MEEKAKSSEEEKKCETANRKEEVGEDWDWVPEGKQEAMEEVEEEKKVEEEKVEEEVEEEEVEEEEVEEEDTWDPMSAHFYSRTNVYGAAGGLQNAPGFAILGGLTPQVEMNTKDIPCPFYDRTSERCFKQECYYMHPKKGSKDYDPVKKEKIIRVPINHKHNLLGKEGAAVDSIMKVKVQYAKHPWKFYVTSEKEWGCHCKPTNKIDVTQERLEKEMTEKLLLHFAYKNRQSEDYIEFELVAVLMTRNGEKVFCRGIVLESTIDQEDGKMRSVKIQLLETGEKLVVDFDKVCTLSDKYTREVPVLAYRCMLHGISPILRWTDGAINRFKELVVGKECIMTIKKTISGDYVYDLFEDNEPYQVELRVKYHHPVTGVNKYYSVAELLAEDGLGVLWAPTPLVPEITGLSNAELALISRAVTLSDLKLGSSESRSLAKRFSKKGTDDPPQKS